MHMKAGHYKIVFASRIVSDRKYPDVKTFALFLAVTEKVFEEMA